MEWILEKAHLDKWRISPNYGPHVSFDREDVIFFVATEQNFIEIARREFLSSKKTHENHILSYDGKEICIKT